jgi:hypothetical protein
MHISTTKSLVDVKKELGKKFSKKQNHIDFTRASLLSDQTHARATFCHKKRRVIRLVFLSGWQDSNLRPPAPKAGAMTGLRYTPRCLKKEA